MTQKPHGPEDEWCPLWRKQCSKVCHTCKWWGKSHLTTNPNTGENVELWDCAISRTVNWQIENAAAARHGAAATESFRNIMVEQNNAMLHRVAKHADATNGKLLEG